MSGASALAAAKRRRAVPAEPTRPNSSPQKTNQLPKPVQTSVSANVQTPSQNPLQLLIQHEQRLNDLEKNVAQLKLNDKKLSYTVNYPFDRVLEQKAAAFKLGNLLSMGRCSSHQYGCCCC